MQIDESLSFKQFFHVGDHLLYRHSYLSADLIRAEIKLVRDESVTIAYDGKLKVIDRNLLGYVFRSRAEYLSEKLEGLTSLKQRMLDEANELQAEIDQVGAEIAEMYKASPTTGDGNTPDILETKFVK